MCRASSFYHSYHYYRVNVAVDETFVSKTCHSKHWLESLQLWQCDKYLILSPTGSLNKFVINASQQIFSQQFPNLHGFQDVLFFFGEFLQIVNTGHRHWITISTIGMSQTGSVNNKVFDSMNDYFPTTGSSPSC